MSFDFQLIPKKEHSIGFYASIFHEKAFFIFGGEGSDSDFNSQIGRLDALTRKWSFAGSLKQAGVDMKVANFFYKFSIVVVTP